MRVVCVFISLRYVLCIIPTVVVKFICRSVESSYLADRLLAGSSGREVMRGFELLSVLFLASMRRRREEPHGTDTA